MEKSFLICLLLTISFGTMAFFSKKDKRKVIFFGDSITQAAVDSGGYINQLQMLLKEQKRGDEFQLVGAGISGNKVPDLKDRLFKDVLSQNPDLVFIYIGINDVWHFSHVCCKDREGGTSKEKFEAGLLDIVNKIKGNGADVVLCTPTVIGEKKTFENEQHEMLEEYVNIVRKVSEKYNSRLCDLSETFRKFIEENNPDNLDKGILTYDGVHLNLKGNALVAKKIFQFLD